MLDHKISPYTHLMQRVSQKSVNAMVRDSKDTGNIEKQPEKTTVSIDDFVKIDLRTARILEASDVENSKKLIALKVDLGSETRQILAGIKGHYQPESLVGRNVVIVANLAARKMKFGVSRRDGLGSR